jgi:hypothetical protein
MLQKPIKQLLEDEKAIWVAKSYAEWLEFFGRGGPPFRWVPVNWD